MFRHSVLSNPLRPHVMQHARLPCPSHLPGFLLLSVTNYCFCRIDKNELSIPLRAKKEEDFNLAYSMLLYKLQDCASFQKSTSFFPLLFVNTLSGLLRTWSLYDSWLSVSQAKFTWFGIFKLKHDRIIFTFITQFRNM